MIHYRVHALCHRVLLILRSLREELSRRFCIFTDEEKNFRLRCLNASRCPSVLLLLMETLFQDLRYGIRALSKNRTFSTAAILTLALGIGATTSVFSVVDAVLLRPLPYRNPGRLVALRPVERNDPSPGTSIAEFEQWRGAKSFQDLAILYRNFGVSRVTLTGAAEPESVQAGFTSANLFPLLGVAPALGRTFTPEEERRGEAVAILSDALFERRFARSPLALGNSIEIEGRAFRIIGVMPASFDFPAKNVALWAPLTTNAYWSNRAEDPFKFRWEVFARLRDGVSLRAAQSEMDALYSHLTSQDARFAGGPFRSRRCVSSFAATREPPY